MKFLPYKDAKLEAHVVLQINCYFAHSESILLAAGVDSNEAIANFALVNILKARKSNDATSSRIFSKQDISLNFGTTSYYLDIIDRSLIKVSFPPVLQNLIDELAIIQVAQKL